MTYFCTMSDNNKNPYQLFTQEILDNWKSQDVEYIKVEELASVNNATLFELIPDSELIDGGDTDILYAIDSEDVEDMLLPSKTVRFVVHDIYLGELD